jgi:hypothetical protein
MKTLLNEAPRYEDVWGNRGIDPRTLNLGPRWGMRGQLHAPGHQNGHIPGCNQKFPDWVDNEIHAYNNKHSLRSNTKGYGGKTQKTDAQNSDTTAPSGREVYHLQFSLQAASPETFGYILVRNIFIFDLL